MKSIRSKILASQIVVILLLSLILGISSYFLMATYLRKIQKEELSLISKYEAGLLQNSIRHSTSIITRISESKQVKNYSKYYQEHPLVEFFSKFRKTMHSLAYVDENGFEDVKVIRGDLSVDLKNLNRTAFYQKAMQNRNTVVVSFSFEDLDIGVSTLNFAIAKYDYFDKFNGVITGAVPISAIAKSVEKFQIGQNGFACLIDEDGTFLSFPSERVNSRKHSGKIKKATEFTAKADVRQSGFIRANILDTDCFIAHTPIPIMKWSLLVVLPYNEFMEAPNLIKKTVIASFCIVLAIGILISLSVSGTITKPLKKLVTSTDAIARGDLSKKVDIKSQDEIGVLAQYFNGMVTELDKSRNKLISAKDFMENIIESMNDALIVLDSDKTIKKVNSAFCDLLLYQKDEILGKPMSTVMPLSDMAFESKKADDLAANGDTFPVEKRYLSKDGKKIPVIFSNSILLDNSGNIHGFVCVAQDITEIKDAREKLQKAHDDLEIQVRNRTTELYKTNEELEIKIKAHKMAKDELHKAYEELKATQSQLVQSGKLASIGELASGVAHELNQPLMVIRGNTQLIQRRLRKNSLDIDKLMEQLNPIERNTKRMMNIINHLRTFSRQAQSEFQPVDVNLIIEESFLMVGEQLHLRNIEVKKKLMHGLPKVQGDANQLEQVFLNLITNARDALEMRDYGRGTMDEGGGTSDESRRMKDDSINGRNGFRGRLEITTRMGETDNQQSTINNQQSKGFIEILVRDNGGGIPEDKVEKIFDPFFTTKEVGKGTGLGLSISYGIIKDHNGEIEVAETGPQGTTLRIRFPIVDG